MNKLKIEHLWSLTVLVGIFIFLNTHPIRPHDFWWHLAVGREIVLTGQIPESDIYSQSEFGQPYLSYRSFWLMEVVLYQIFTLGGAALVIFFHSLAITGCYALLLILCLRASRSWRIAAFCTLYAAVLGFNDWNVRPQAITFLLGTLFLMAIVRFQVYRHTVWLAVFPLLMLVWVNSHGTFPIGLVILTLWFLSESIDLFTRKESDLGINWRKGLLPPLISLTLTFLASLVNPSGVSTYRYLVNMSTNPVIQNLVPEWAAPTFRTSEGVFFFISLIILAVVLVLSHKRFSIAGLLTTLAFAVLALKTSRGIVWFGIITAPVLAGLLPALLARFMPVKEETVGRKSFQWINLTLGLLLLFMSILSLPWLKQYLPLPPEKAGQLSVETPVAAVDFLLEVHVPPPVFHAMPYGSYLIWQAQPDYRVFVDSRLELYPLKIWEQYFAISQAQVGWENLLATHGVQTLLLSWQDQPKLIEAVQDSSDWNVVYSDHETVIATRSMHDQ